MWKEGCIKEVARVYHEVHGASNITYEIYPDKIIFKSDGLLKKTHLI